MAASEDERELEDELLACLQSDDEEEAVTDTQENQLMPVFSKWERFIHLGEDLTTRICMVRC